MVSPKQMTIPFPKMDHTFADFFCGCGGLSLGLIQAGLKCISAMDISPDALSTYWYNLCYKTWSHLWVDQNNKKAIKSIQKWTNGGETQNFLFPCGVPDNWLEVPEPMPCLNLFCYSILDMEPEEWMQYCGVRPGDIKIFVGGPPCQGFSTANERRSIYDERNQLPLRYLYYAKIAKPDYVLIENVPGLLSLGKKKGEKEGPFVRWIREAFADAGYDMNYDVHNAADYGVPQNRHRVIFIGTRRGISKLNFPKGLYGDGTVFTLLPEIIGRTDLYTDKMVIDLTPCTISCSFHQAAVGNDILDFTDFVNRHQLFHRLLNVWFRRGLLLPLTGHQ